MENKTMLLIGGGLAVGAAIYFATRDKSAVVSPPNGGSNILPAGDTPVSLGPTPPVTPTNEVYSPPKDMTPKEQEALYYPVVKPQVQVLPVFIPPPAVPQPAPVYIPQPAAPIVKPVLNPETSVVPPALRPAVKVIDPRIIKAQSQIITKRTMQGLGIAYIFN